MKIMKLAVFVVLVVVSSLVVYAGSISNFKSPDEVRNLTANALGQWVSDPVGHCERPDNADCIGSGDPAICCTGSGTGTCLGGGCCSDTSANLGCTGAGAPDSCCTGAGTGTCNEEACVTFANAIEGNQAAWYDNIESSYPFDSDFFCNRYLKGGLPEVACTSMNSTLIIDVSAEASRIANRRHPPF